MKLEYYLDFNGVRGESGLMYAAGDFGVIDGLSGYTVKKDGARIVYEYKNDKICLKSVFTEYEHGVFIRKDEIENLTDKMLRVNLLKSRFRLPDNDYEVYTQYNGWQHESSGKWQPLVTQIATAGKGIRSCHVATPLMALHNVHTKKNVVFHLFPNGLWEMSARKYPSAKNELVIVETGFNGENADMRLKPNGKILLPTVMFFEADSKIDLDAYKLHTVYNELYPRRKALPILYNSWLYCYDDINVDELKRQAAAAAELGIEAFMVDAGWFGYGNWGEGVGDWTENLTSGPKGRLLELSEYVRGKGMIFGLWFEPERAGTESRAKKEHPEYYIDGRFFDFANEKARAYMLSVISEQIEKYSLGWLKFDFNDSIPLDETGDNFYYYIQGQKSFVEEIYKKYPYIYITNCAGGGARMDLEQGTFTDSFWLSDNQGPYEGIRIVKDTLKRMPTALIERWNVQKILPDVKTYGQLPKARLINTDDGLWSTARLMNDSFTENFMIGGPLGMSCDIASFPDMYKIRWKEIIAQYKKDREFYRTATARILIDESDMTCIQYSDRFLSKCVVQLFTKLSYAADTVIYPVVDEDAEYSYGDTVLKGREIMRDGIMIKNITDNSCFGFELNKQ